MNWLKSNWPIVVLGIVALVALPALWVVSSGWNQKLVDQLQSTVSEDYKSVTNSRNSYRLTGLTGETLLDNNTDLNSKLNKAYEEIGAQMLQQSGKVGQSAVEFNKGSGENEHKLLIDGIFPEPADPLEAKLKPNQFVAAYIRKHPEMLKRINAGTPPPASELAAQLTEMLAQKVQQYEQEHGAGDMDSAAKKELAEQLQGYRLSRYQSRAAEIQVYADASVFADIPTEPLDRVYTLAECWDMQERLWIHGDIVRAIGLVNGSSDGRGVPGSIVKRIVRVAVARPLYIDNQGKVAFAQYSPGVDLAPTDFSRSITGRISGPGSQNKWYDLRTVEVELVIDSRQIPKFIDALAAVNFMSVTAVNMSRAEPLKDLAEGYYYGDDNVVRATFTIETVWFREWRKNASFTPDDNKPGDNWKQWWMPLDIQKAMAMVEGVQAETEAPPPQPVRPRAAPRDDEDLGGRRGRNRGGD